MSEGVGVLSQSPFIPSQESGDWEELLKSSDLVKTIEVNVRLRASHAAAEAAEGIISDDELDVRLKLIKLSINDVLNDAQCMELIDEIVSQPQFKARVSNAKTKAVLGGATDRVHRLLTDNPDLTFSKAKDALELITKAAVQMAKLPQECEPVRSLSFLLGLSRIITPEAHYEIRITSLESVLDIIRMMRCTSLDEAKAVIYTIKENAPMFYQGGITLRGW
jgi:hypothetical protein